MLCCAAICVKRDPPEGRSLEFRAALRFLGGTPTKSDARLVDDVLFAPDFFSEIFLVGFFALENRAGFGYSSRLSDKKEASGTFFGFA